MSKYPAYRLLLTCEHASAAIPLEYADLFVGHAELLESHSGWDAGALGVANALAAAFTAPVFAGRYSRQLIDLNRSVTHPQRYSAFTKVLPTGDREQLHAMVYQPFRDSVLAAVRAAVEAKETVLHLSVHSFTPILYGKERSADIALLYDPQRKPEREFANAWRHRLNEMLPAARLRMNYPYRGTADGHCTALRRQFSAKHYLGFELELNQAALIQRQFPQAWIQALIASVREPLSCE